MVQNVLIAVAWPYANADIHVGNLTGSYLPADICARYHRLRGRNVLMVSGSDSHGTPITVKADAQGKTPVEVYQAYHERFLALFQKMGLTYDLFTSTHTSNHFQISQLAFTTLNENGFLYTATNKQWYSTAQERFLPDRYVEGTCYFCGNPEARSDQCEKCGHMLEPELLLNPRSKIDGSTPILKETEHFYLDLSNLEPEIVAFLKAREDYWRPNVIRQSLGQILADGLKGRPITRDLDWGIPVPLDGWQGKCLYVWFEAVIGYLSASIEWSRLNGTPDAWREWWVNQESKTFYFIGKDNIPFHAVIWPAELIGFKDDIDRVLGAQNPQKLVLPYDVPANEFMNLEGRKISGSHNWAVWGLDFLERYDPDPLRYYLTTAMPESKDTDWDWEEFFQRNNNELVATWGNLVNRVLAFTYKHWEGVIPQPGELRESDLELLQTIRSGFDSVAEKMESVQLRAALSEVMSLATEVNKYLDVHAPWFEIKTDKNEAAKSVFTAIQAIDWLKIMFAPFIPFTSENLHKTLGNPEPIFGCQEVRAIEDKLGCHQILTYKTDGCLIDEGVDLWRAATLKAGKPFNQPVPLVKKLDHSIVEDERARLGN
ncbi:MAG: methionine--tRNA ligase [Anaerolineaceae bacterium]